VNSIILACIGAGISFYGIIQYLYGILRHGTQPRMASWVAWLTANTVFSVVAFHNGAYLAVAINGIAAFTNLLVIVASVKQRVSMKPGDTIDWSCLIMAIICIVIVVAIPGDKTLGALFAMVANVVATIPTLRHAWTRPNEETWQLFAANGFANGLSLMSILLVSGFEFTSVAGPLMAVIGNGSLVMITVGRTWMTSVEEEIIDDLRIVEDTLIHPVDSEGDE
jgi:hypothetical protein